MRPSIEKNINTLAVFVWELKHLDGQKYFLNQHFSVIFISVMATRSDNSSNASAKILDFIQLSYYMRHVH